MNPTYYNLEDVEHDSVNVFLSNLVENAVNELEESYCVEVEDEVWCFCCGYKKVELNYVSQSI